MENNFYKQYNILETGILQYKVGTRNKEQVGKHIIVPYYE